MLYLMVLVVYTYVLLPELAGIYEHVRGHLESGEAGNR